MLIPELKKLPKNLKYHKRSLSNPSDSLVFHSPVLLQSACHYLDVKPGRLYVDATVGGGGHSQEIVRRGGKVLGIDQDPDAISEAGNVKDLVLENTNFSHLDEAIEKHNWHPVSGILFDLGVSSHHFDTPGRGFSYRLEGPLDMRMGSSAVTAAEIVNQFPVKQLTSLFKEFGELPNAKSLAEKILKSRPYTTTTDLARITGKWSQQVFQALRIVVNDELGVLETALPKAFDILETGGRLVVISFHSLEDRIVKKTFQDWESQHKARILTDKPVVADNEELQINPRSKSAKLRCIEKI